MKKSINIAFILVFCGLSVAPPTFADPTVLKLAFTCPLPKGNGINVISNFGSYVAGYGSELIDDNPAFNTPYFIGNIPSGANIPANIQQGVYVNSGTDFDVTTGMVSCSYKSSTRFDPFTVNYFITNSRGSVITSQSADKININQYVGFRRS